MTAPEPAPAPDPAPQDPPAADPAPNPPTPAPNPAPKPPKRSLEDSLSGLDDETKAFVLGEVQKARQEAGAARTSAKKTAADEARAELAQQIGKALGLVADEPPDPAALTEQVTAATSDARAAKLELAVYRAATAPGVGGDAAALLDSRSFLTSLAEIDPSDAEAVQTAVAAALEANPALKTAPARRTPGPPPPGGSNPPGIDAEIEAARKAGDVKRWMHLENQKLAAPSR